MAEMDGSLFGDSTGPLMTLSEVAAANTGLAASRLPSAWHGRLVSRQPQRHRCVGRQVTIGAVTYDFVVAKVVVNVDNCNPTGSVGGGASIPSTTPR